MQESWHFFNGFVPHFLSLHQNCHHQMVFARFNLKVVFPLPYEREVWHLKKANIVHIRKAINGFQWEKSFQNITCDDRDPPWINSSIRRLTQDKNEAYKSFKRRNNNNQYFENFQSLQNLLGSPLKRLRRDIILAYP